MDIIITEIFKILVENVTKHIYRNFILITLLHFFKLAKANIKPNAIPKIAANKT